MAQQKLFAYADVVSAKPGDRVKIMVSGEGTNSAQAQLVRLIHGDDGPSGPGYIEEEIATNVVPQEVSVTRQYTQLGSYAVVEDPQQLLSGEDSFKLTTWVSPTLVGHGRQSILGTFDISTMQGWSLGVNPHGHLEFWFGDGEGSNEVATEVPMLSDVWYEVGLSYNHASGRVALQQKAVVNSSNSSISSVSPVDSNSSVKEKLSRRIKSSERSLLIGGSWDANPQRGPHVAWLFNGKVDRASMSRDSKVLASWDPTSGLGRSGIDDTIVDTGPNGLHAHGINHPIRGVTGYNWDGETDCFAVRPDLYGGVLFAASSMTDCRWDPTLEFDLPVLKSGCYAIRLRCEDAEEYAPFFVRNSKPTAKVAFQVPTASYLAYANELLAFDAPVAQSITAHTPVLAQTDLELYKTREFGLSTYDHHDDHLNGVCFSTWRRPINNMRPKYRAAAIGCTWQFPADLSIVAWLDQSDFDYEIITDHDLHAEGVELLDNYNVVITGTHPEYYSEQMLEATEDYMDHGGRFMYMGGNGLYWVTSFVDDGDTVEVRKLEGGTRAWQARSGEYYHTADGSRAGIWKNRGRGPAKVTGVGFSSEGMDKSSPFHRLPASHEEEVSWIFDGVETEKFGDFGLAHGGAAGIEIDRYDRRYGTPEHTRLLATSHGHSDGYPLVIEEILSNATGTAGTTSPLVRADVTYTTNASGGASFCTGSIAWGQALPCNDFDNDISQIMANVVARFASDGPMPHLGDAQDDQQVGVFEHWAEMEALSLQQSVTPELVAEFETAPNGPHSDAMLRLLSRFRVPERDGWSVVEHHSPGVDTAGDGAAGERTYSTLFNGDPVGTFASAQDALRDIFRQRLETLAGKR